MWPGLGEPEIWTRKARDRRSRMGARRDIIHCLNRIQTVRNTVKERKRRDHGDERKKTERDLGKSQEMMRRVSGVIKEE